MSRAPSAVGPPARRQRTLLGFLKMSSLTRHSLEQIEVAAGTLAPEQTRNQTRTNTETPGRGASNEVTYYLAPALPAAR